MNKKNEPMFRNQQQNNQKEVGYVLGYYPSIKL